MTTTPNISLTEKERVEHITRSAPPPRARKKETAKQSRSSDQITKAPKKQGLSEAEERSILNNPLASKEAAPQNNEADLYTGSGFPPPGLAFYAAQAMSLAVQADANAMDVYSNLEQSEYNLISEAYQRMADSDRASIMSQASATMWGAISQTVMGGLTFGGGLYGAVRMAKLAKEQSGLNNDKNALTSRLGKIAEVNEADDEDIKTQVNEAKAGGEKSVATRLREASEKFDRDIKFQDDLKKFEADSRDKPNDEWELEVGSRFDNGQDGFANQLSNEKDAFIDRINKYNADHPADQISNEVRAKLLQPFNDRENELNTAKGKLLEGPANEEAYNKQKAVLTKEFDDTKKQLTEKKEETKRGIDEIDTDLKALKAKGTEIQGHISMVSGFGQLGQAFNFGKMSAEIGQAQQQYEKSKAQQAQTMNEAIRGEVARQWSTLAQAADSAMQEYASTMKSINQSLRA